MRQHTRWMRVLGVLAGASLLATACSGDDDGGDGDQAEDVDPAIAALRETGNARPGCNAEADGVFKIGGLLAQTGSLGESLGRAQIAGANLAVADINAAGGVNEEQVVFEQRDSGDEASDVASASVQQHLDAGVDAVVGASSSGVTENQMEAVVDACRIMMSPSNTGRDFTTIEDDDLYFRTAAADVLQGRALADLASEEGARTAAILHADEGYRQGMATDISTFFEERGGRVVLNQAYDPAVSEFATEVGEVVAADPDALFVVGSAESAALFNALVAEGFTPATKKIYFVEGNMSDAVGAAVGQPGALVGVKGTIPGARVPEPLQVRLEAADPALPAYTFAPETYDAVIVLALAAEAAETDQSDTVARYINAVTRGGVKCATFEQCKTLLQTDEDIDYDGQSGPLDFALPGEPAAASYVIYGWNPDNTVNHDTVETRDVRIS